MKYASYSSALSAAKTWHKAAGLTVYISDNRNSMNRLYTLSKVMDDNTITQIDALTVRMEYDYWTGLDEARARSERTGELYVVAPRRDRGYSYAVMTRTCFESHVGCYEQFSTHKAVEVHPDGPTEYVRPFNVHGRIASGVLKGLNRLEHELFSRAMRGDVECTPITLNCIEGAPVMHTFQKARGIPAPYKLVSILIFPTKVEVNYQ